MNRQDARDALSSRIASILIESSPLAYDTAHRAAQRVVESMKEDYQTGKLPGFRRLFGDSGMDALRNGSPEEEAMNVLAEEVFDVNDTDEDPPSDDEDIFEVA